MDSLKKSLIVQDPMLVSQQMQMLKDNALNEELSVQSLSNNRWRIDIPANKFPSEIPDINIPPGMSASLVINIAQNIMEAMELQKNGQPVSRAFYRKAVSGNTALFPYDAIYTT